ncbi:hypothetical protein NLG97_g801 [Lecanicillium saksenae]|uniref:Uncharacterized protein n=1 Tax=Lecanicillium saksenae TaxID=468837 RepID=A0ACC1R667_9HYPO|nr:hypothetical protein NLG97_g801 [Lecanicillium saksenae]
MAANQHDWHSVVSVTDRYGTVRSIQEALPDGSMSTAMAIEQAAYTDSASLDAYTATCNAAIAASSTAPATSGPAEEEVTGDTRIGSYTNCTPIADGVTSTVYRSSDRLTALKVITTHHPLPPHSPQREISILRGLDAASSRCIPLLDAFRDQEQQQVLAFPYKPLTLEAVLLGGLFQRSRLNRGAWSTKSSLRPTWIVPWGTSLICYLQPDLLHTREAINAGVSEFGKAFEAEDSGSEGRRLANAFLGAKKATETRL